MRLSWGIAAVSIGVRWDSHLTLAQQTKELASSHKIHHHVQVVDVLERSPEVDEERVSYPDQHFSFRIGVLNLLHLDHFLFVEDFDSVESAVVLGTNQVNTPKRTSAKPNLISLVPLSDTHVLSMWKSPRA